MRTLQIALVAATLTIPSAGYSEDQGLVGGRVGAGLESSPAERPSSSWSNPYVVPPRAPQEHPGFAGATAPGQVASHNTAVFARPGGMGSATVNGHSVLVNPSTNRIQRVFN
jgi:hypothetical protein